MTPPTDPIRILHVDDEPDFAEIVATFLERADDRITVRTATIPDGGLSVMADHNVDCIVSDYDMARTTGLEFLETVRGEYPDLPFILYTGKGSEEVAADAISTGVTDYLQKESGTDQYTVLANRITNAVDSYRSKQLLTEREQDLRRYEWMVNSMQEAACIYDEDGRFELVNEYLAEWYGTTSDALRGESSTLIRRVREQAVDTDPYEELLEGQREQLSGELTSEFPGQGYAVVEYQLTPLIVDGSVEGVVGVARDITERKERTRELHRHKRAMDEAPVGITISDPDREDNPIIYANNGFRSLTGYGDDETLGRNCRFLQGEDTESEPVATMREAIDREERVTVQLRNYRHDGTEFWNRVSVAPVRDDDGSVVNFVGFQQDITAHKQREIELERARDLLDQSERIADVGGWEIDTDTMDVFWTENLFELLGVDYDEEPPLEEALDVYHEEDRPVVENAVETAIGSGEPFDVEVRFHRPDGELRWLRVQGTPTTDEETVVTLRGTVQDITAQKQMEHDLRHERDLVTGIVETSPVGIAVVTADGDISFANERAETIYGRPREEIDEMSHDDPRWELINEDGEPLESGEAPFDRVISRETAIRDQVVGIRRPSGKRVWLSVHGAPQWNTDGDFEHAVFAFEDITDRVELEGELEEILGRVSDAFFALDDEFRFSHVNRRAEELMEVSEENLLGETLWDMYPEAAEADKIWDSFHEAMDTQAPQSYELYYEPLDFWVEATVYPSETGVSVYFRDVTEDKEYQRRLERQNDQLEEFASVVSHDLRNPLAVAQGRLELVREDCDSGQLDPIECAHNRMQGLIEDLLTVAREGNVGTDTRPVELSEMAASCWANVETGNGSLVIDTNQMLLADTSRLKQVFENLMRNAIEHGGDTVTVTVGRLDDGFYIEDDGSGIPSGDRDDVFEAGYSTNSDGTGFGLRITEQIVEAHDWAITLTEGTAGGARFEITGCESVSM